MRRQRSTSSSWIATRALGGRLGAHLVERPAEVDRGRAGTPASVVVGRVDVLAASPPRAQPVRSSDADRRSPAHRKRPDRLRHLGGRAAAQLDLFVGQPPLVEHDDRVILETDDAIWLELARRAW